MYARFKALNPQTGYDPQRAYKWLQGRSSPRDAGIYEDIARLLDLPVTGEAVRNCSFAEFRAMIEPRRGALAEELGQATALVPASRTIQPASLIPAPAPSSTTRPPAYLAGRYLAISQAWAPSRRGWLLVGILTITPDTGTGMAMRYEENLPDGLLVMTGALQRIGRNVLALAINAEDEMFISFSLQIPPAPALALFGIFNGAASHDLDMRPTASRILCLRADPVAPKALMGLSRYIPDEPEILCQTLLAIGISGSRVVQLSEKLRDYLNADGGLIDTPLSLIAPLIEKLYDMPRTE
ncbi:hypothetical protein AUP43_08370 [Oceanibaculum pacificum]|uniref:Uncharacterized protein n=2 Tax=Oceanibaculum pacificum TaxID=580166 RepID=A0A154W5E9_9PROT|nr:hypothetical protein AUP43_08370 [Oceanibaculum pacificum]